MICKFCVFPFSLGYYTQSNFLIDNIIAVFALNPQNNAAGKITKRLGKLTVELKRYFTFSSC